MHQASTLSHNRNKLQLRMHHACISSSLSPDNKKIIRSCFFVEKEAGGYLKPVHTTLIIQVKSPQAYTYTQSRREGGYLIGDYYHIFHLHWNYTITSSWLLIENRKNENKSNWKYINFFSELARLDIITGNYKIKVMGIWIMGAYNIYILVSE